MKKIKELAKKIAVYLWRECGVSSLKECEKIVIESLESHIGPELEEHQKLRQLFEKVIKEHAWYMDMESDIDGGSLQDMAEELGIIIEVPATEDEKDEFDADTVFTWAWSDRAALEKARE